MSSPTEQVTFLKQAIITILGWSWLEYLTAVGRFFHQAWGRNVKDGMYEVLSYETTLELKNGQGSSAVFTKRQKVCYLQNNIIAYQDQAWGDGEILLDYKCSPGIEVDRYRPAHRTFILISLREEKQKGDVDQFFITWGIRDGFLRPTELWGSEVSHRTHYLNMQVILPKSRPPLDAVAIERLSHKKHPLKQEIQQLADGRWLVQWETKRPKLNETYLIQWEW